MRLRPSCSHTARVLNSGTQFGKLIREFTGLVGLALAYDGTGPRYLHYLVSGSSGLTHGGLAGALGSSSTCEVGTAHTLLTPRCSLLHTAQRLLV